MEHTGSLQVFAMVGRYCTFLRTTFSLAAEPDAAPQPAAKPQAGSGTRPIARPNSKRRFPKCSAAPRSKAALPTPAPAAMPSKLGREKYTLGEVKKVGRRRLAVSGPHPVRREGCHAADPAADSLGGRHAGRRRR